ncbi:hypothetical protein [Nakamurella aerolata]|uniref:Uncharacterized protein n=1 Tax=Nakamurella aerolata TaxID=1656892 RepID=A0A849ABH0_9ACTN|nr:hypothetical protein [Nakamurella aerolata]NNG37287.1 hypothetical protein [Nakamurella aerolata]
MTTPDTPRSQGRTPAAATGSDIDPQRTRSMTDENDLRHGHMRPGRAVLITVLCGLITGALCLGVNAMFGSPIDWFWLAGAAVYVTVLIGAFLWIRLAREA